MSKVYAADVDVNVPLVPLLHKKLHGLHSFVYFVLFLYNTFIFWFLIFLLIISYKIKLYKKFKMFLVIVQ